MSLLSTESCQRVNGLMINVSLSAVCNIDKKRPIRIDHDNCKMSLIENGQNCT